jgi:ribosome maturation factor RimP
MIQIETVYQIVEKWIADGALFIVDIKVMPDNTVVVELDSDEGVSIDACAELSRFIEANIDREVEDYELQVSSAGLGQPFKILRQYKKNIGNEVEVLTKTGIKHQGILKSADKESFVLEIEKQVKPEGAKRKITVQEELTFTYEEIKYTKYLIRFK